MNALGLKSWFQFIENNHEKFSGFVTCMIYIVIINQADKSVSFWIMWTGTVCIVCGVVYTKQLVVSVDLNLEF